MERQRVALRRSSTSAGSKSIHEFFVRGRGFMHLSMSTRFPDPNMYGVDLDRFPEVLSRFEEHRAPIVWARMPVIIRTVNLAASFLVVMCGAAEIRGKHRSEDFSGAFLDT